MVEPAAALPTPKYTEKEVPLSAIRPYEQNPRTCSVKEFEQIIDSLKSLGQFRPLPVNHDMTMIGGHQRLKAMALLGWQTVRVSIPDRQLSEKEFLDILIRDNVLNGTWTAEITSLNISASRLKIMGVPLKFTPAKAATAKEEEKRTYTIIFDNDAQREAWDVFMTHLQERYPSTKATTAERLLAFLRETMPAKAA